VRVRLDWKYAIHLELTDPGFDFSILCEFRARLLTRGADHLLFETMLVHFKAHGVLATLFIGHKYLVQLSSLPPYFVRMKKVASTSPQQCGVGRVRLGFACAMSPSKCAAWVLNRHRRSDW
jgi:hypothetical protein